MSLIVHPSLASFIGASCIGASRIGKKLDPYGEGSFQDQETKRQKHKNLEIGKFPRLGKSKFKHAVLMTKQPNTANLNFSFYFYFFGEQAWIFHKRK
jgi:hypothetical protein